MTPFDAEQMADGLKKFVEKLENEGGALAKQWFESDGFVRAAHWNTASTAHLQKLFAEHMAKRLAGLNMPTRDDVTALGERLMALEERLSHIETLLIRMAPKDALTAPVGPARTRKPPEPPEVKPEAPKPRSPRRKNGAAGRRAKAAAMKSDTRAADEKASVRAAAKPKARSARAKIKTPGTGELQ